MSTHDDADSRIGGWFAGTAAAGSPDYAAEIMAIVDRTPQDRRPAWLRAPWRPGPAEAPVASMGFAVAVVGFLVLALVATLLLAGSRPKPPPFALQAIVPLAGSSGTIFVGTGPDGIWVTADQAALHVDAVTHEVTSVPVPLHAGTFTGVMEAGGSLWAADYSGGRVLRMDRASGMITAEIQVTKPVSLAWRDGVWAMSGGRDGLVHIDPRTNVVDQRVPLATAFALGADSLWYTETVGTEAAAVEIEPSTGVERSRVAIPYAVAGSVAVDGLGNVYAWRGGTQRSQLAIIRATTHVVSDVIVFPHDLWGGVVAIGDSMWGFVGPGTDGRSRVIQIGPDGPTGREETLAPGLDPDIPVVAFGSVWIPFDNHAALYRYPSDALAP